MARQNVDLFTSALDLNLQGASLINANFLWQGSSSTSGPGGSIAYQTGDIVVHNNHVYEAKIANDNIEPGTTADSNFDSGNGAWTLVAGGGASGTYTIESRGISGNTENAVLRLTDGTNNDDITFVGNHGVLVQASGDSTFNFDYVVPAYDNTITYQRGNLVRDTSGQIFEALNNLAAGVALTDTTSWLQLSTGSSTGPDRNFDRVRQAGNFGTVGYELFSTNTGAVFFADAASRLAAWNELTQNASTTSFYILPSTVNIVLTPEDLGANYTGSINELRFDGQGANSIVFQYTTARAAEARRDTGLAFARTDTVNDPQWEQGVGINLTVDTTNGRITIANSLPFDDASRTKLEGIETGAQVNVATNLGVDTRTTTTLNVTSSTGTDATIPGASGSEAGLLSAADKTKLDTVESNANNFTLPDDVVDSNSNFTINTGQQTSSGSVAADSAVTLNIAADTTPAWVPDNNPNYLSTVATDNTIDGDGTTGSVLSVNDSVYSNTQIAPWVMGTTYDINQTVRHNSRVFVSTAASNTADPFEDFTDIYSPPITWDGSTLAFRIFGNADLHPLQDYTYTATFRRGQENFTVTMLGANVTETVFSTHHSISYAPASRTLTFGSVQEAQAWRDRFTTDGTNFVTGIEGIEFRDTPDGSGTSQVTGSLQVAAGGTFTTISLAVGRTDLTNSRSFVLNTSNPSGITVIAPFAADAVFDTVHALGALGSNLFTFNPPDDHTWTVIGTTWFPSRPPANGNTADTMLALPTNPNFTAQSDDWLTVGGGAGGTTVITGGGTGDVNLGIFEQIGAAAEMQIQGSGDNLEFIFDGDDDATNSRHFRGINFVNGRYVIDFRAPGVAATLAGTTNLTNNSIDLFDTRISFDITYTTTGGTFRQSPAAPVVMQGSSALTVTEDTARSNSTMSVWAVTGFVTSTLTNITIGQFTASLTRADDSGTDTVTVDPITITINDNRAITLRAPAAQEVIALHGGANTVFTIVPTNIDLNNTDVTLTGVTIDGTPLGTVPTLNRSAGTFSIPGMNFIPNDNYTVGINIRDERLSQVESYPASTTYRSTDTRGISRLDGPSDRSRLSTERSSFTIVHTGSVDIPFSNPSVAEAITIGGRTVNPFTTIGDDGMFELQANTFPISGTANVRVVVTDSRIPGDPFSGAGTQAVRIYTPYFWGTASAAPSTFNATKEITGLTTVTQDFAIGQSVNVTGTANEVLYFVVVAGSPGFRLQNPISMNIVTPVDVGDIMVEVPVLGGTTEMLTYNIFNAGTFTNNVTYNIIAA